MSDKPIVISPDEAEKLRAEQSEAITKIAEAARPVMEAMKPLAEMHQTKPELFDDGNSSVRAMLEWYAPTGTGNHSRKVMAAGFAFNWKKHGPMLAGAGGLVALGYKVFDRGFDLIANLFHIGRHLP